MNDFCMFPQDPVRRRLLVALASAMLASRAELISAKKLCPDDPGISDLAAPLTIDTHAHFFNGRDLQVRQFLSQTNISRDSELYSLVDGASALLQALAWRRAPDAKRERGAIIRYTDAMKRCGSGADIRTAAIASFQEGYAIGRRELQKASGLIERSNSAGGAALLGSASPDGGLGTAIRALPESFEKFESERKSSAKLLGGDKTAAGYLRFILHSFNYRHINAISYLESYSKDSSRKIDLVVASMVDYDWWLARGAATPTSLAEQVDLMANISILLDGRVHGFVPFCPFREIMTMKSDGLGDSMRLVRFAVETHGFIGVKLYPPMGFAAFGNSNRDVWRDKPGLPSAARDQDFGKRLDAAMARLFAWCLEQDVPIMAHSNHSNGPNEDFKNLAGSEGWQQALQRFPGLSVSFGHFGDSDLEDHKGENTRRFLALMTSEARSAGARAFSDSGYFAGVLTNQLKMRDVLLDLYKAVPGVVCERLMYGSDWSMILTQKNSENYLADFAEVIERVERVAPDLGARNGRLADAFFGRNAAEFLGLLSGRGNRRRLEAFYGLHNIEPPDWMRKVDAIS
jgi:Predicted metal-dependent hydrolase of the TIM-barrel fold